MINFIVPERGQSPVRLMLYLFGPGKANEHRDQRVIAADESLGVADGTPLDIGDPTERAQIVALGEQMDAHRKAMGVQAPNGHVWHCALSLPKGEVLSQEQWAQAARSAMAAMGFDASSGKSPCRWAAVYHGTSIDGMEHIHLAVNLVREDGTFASTWRDRKTMSRVCADLERRFELSVVEGRFGAGMPGVSRAELERTRRAARAATSAPDGRQRIEPDRLRLARIVRGCAAAAGTEADFVRRLRQAQLRVRPRYAAGGRSSVVGYSVAPRQAIDGKTPLWMGGGSLARDLTLPALRSHWKTSRQSQAEALTEWSRGGGQPRRAADRSDNWDQAAAVVEQVRRELATVPPGETAVWAGAAREAAGILALWSLRIETRGPGPLAAASEELARSAQTPEGAPRAVRCGSVRDLRGVAMMASVATGHGSGELLLLMQMIRLIEAVAEVRRERGHARQAAALSAAAQETLTRVQRQRARIAFNPAADTSATALQPQAPPQSAEPRPAPAPPSPGPEIDPGMGG